MNHNPKDKFVLADAVKRHENMQAAGKIIMNPNITPEEMAAGRVVCYHGTSKENAESILREGFMAGSYFAYRVEDSLKFGGLYLFAVGFSADPALWHGEPNGFQFHLRQAIGPEEILWHTSIVQELITEAIQSAQRPLREAQGLVSKQAEDDGLWFRAETTPEAYLQHALRTLHAIIEGEGPMLAVLERPLQQRIEELEQALMYLADDENWGIGKNNWIRPNYPAVIARKALENKS